MCCPLSRVGVSDRIVAKGVWDGSAFQRTGRVALSFTKPRKIQDATQTGSGGGGSGRCHGGCGLYVVLTDDLFNLHVPGVPGVLVQPGYGWLGDGSVRAEHRFIYG
jgi:hypothetical protein